MDSNDEITELARRWSEGDDEALDRLIARTYPKLRRLARRHLDAGRGDPTLDTTALVHEAFIRVAEGTGGVWPSRAHFFAFCSKVMRRVLIDYARRNGAQRRGGGRIRVPLSEEALAVEAQAADLLEIDDALSRLALRDQRMAQVVECRFFGGLSIDETAEVVGASTRTVVREWTRARAYLIQALQEEDGAARTGSD